MYMQRCSTFFSLFVDFKGYIDFFLLQDIVADNYSTVKIATTFDDFNTSAVQSCLED